MAEPRWLDEREAHLWRSWLRLNQELTGVLETQIKHDNDLSGPDYAVLVPLSESRDGVLRARELRREILWDRSRLSHHVARMEKRGLVTREDCDTDARGAMVRITPAGRAAIESAAPGHVAATRLHFFDHLTDDEIDTLTDVFDRILTRLGDDPERGGRRSTRSRRVSRRPLRK